MEATGQYWKPVWYILEERGFELLLVNARHMKILPGHKTDVGDAEWLAELLEHGLLRGSFVPPATIRELRDLTRYRKRLIQTHSSEAQRIAKTWRTRASGSRHAVGAPRSYRAIGSRAPLRLGPATDEHLRDARLRPALRGDPPFNSMAQGPHAGSPSSAELSVRRTGLDPSASIT